MKNKKKIEQAIAFLENYSEWRRGAEIKQPDPVEIGKALELVIKTAKGCITKKPSKIKEEDSEI
jgi:hypothetical protein